MTCPRCGSTDIRVSRSSRWSDVFQRFLGRDPVRCRKCRLRFFVSESALSEQDRAVVSRGTHRPGKRMSHRTGQGLTRRLVMLTIFAVAGLVFWFFLRYLTAI